MSLFRRIRLFVRDYCDEFGVAWSLARMRDCERRGGHRWGPATSDDALGQVCLRCGCGAYARRTAVSTASTAITTTTTTPYRFDATTHATTHRR